MGTVADIRARDLSVALVSIVVGLALGPLSSGESGAQPVAAGRLQGPLPLQVDVGLTYDDNVTRARDAQDTRTDTFLSVNARSGFIYPVSPTSRIIFDGWGSVDAFHQYSGLSRVGGEVQVRLEYRESPNFFAPTLAVFGRAAGEAFNSSLRSGYRYSVGVSARQTLTDRITLIGTAAYNVRNGNSAVWDDRDYSILVNLDYSLGRKGTLFLSGEYRRGDAVSTGRPTLDNLDIAEVFVEDDVFTNPQLFSYRFNANTVVSTLGYNVPLGQAGSLEISWRWARGMPTQKADFPGASTSPYIDNQFGIAYLFRF